MSETGKKTFQPNRINWSYLYLGTIALIKAKIKNKNNIFIINQIGSGIRLKGAILIGDNQPPKNKIEPIAHISKMFAYSPSQNKAYIIPEYSVWYPATNSASASGKSNGGLLVSASEEIKNITNIGNKGIANQTFFCAKTISTKFNEPTQSSTVTIIKPIETSYDTICAADRRAPRNGYFEFDAQPAIIIP